MVRRCVRSRNLMNDEAMARVGPQRHKGKKIFFFENRAVCDNVEKYYRQGQATVRIWLMRIACWMPKSTKSTHSGCVIIIAYPPQQWLHELTSMLRSTFTVFFCYNLIFGVLCNGRYYKIF